MPYGDKKDEEVLGASLSKLKESGLQTVEFDLITVLTPKTERKQLVYSTREYAKERLCTLEFKLQTFSTERAIRATATTRYSMSDPLS